MCCSIVQSAAVTAGWPDFAQHGDIQIIPNTPCDDALNADRGSGSLPGATFYLGGTSGIEIASQGNFEIHRRLQGNSLVSVQTIDTTTADQLANNLSYLQNALYTTSGNNKDTVIHGLFWAPRGQLDFGNVTNVANGMLLGGAVGARVQLQASGSANKFVIRVENSPIPNRLRIDSTATKNGQSTTMSAIVVADDTGLTARRVGPRARLTLAHGVVATQHLDHPRRVGPAERPVNGERPGEVVSGRPVVHRRFPVGLRASGRRN